MNAAIGRQSWRRGAYGNDPLVPGYFEWAVEAGQTLSQRCSLDPRLSTGTPPASPLRTFEAGLPKTLVQNMICGGIDGGSCLMTGEALFTGILGAAGLLGACLTWPGAESAGADEWSNSTTRHHVYRHHYGWFGPRSHYAAAIQTGVYDSCWRRRVIETPWGPDVLSKWICHNYRTYGSDYDWGYGTAPADRYYGHPWWWGE